MLTDDITSPPAPAPSSLLLIRTPTKTTCVNPDNEKSRRDYREGVEGKTLSFASFALGHLVATSTSIRDSIAHRGSLFDALVSALRLRLSAKGGGGGGPGGSPPQAVACAALCLAHVATSESAALLTRAKILAACVAFSSLLDVCIDQMAAAAKAPEGGGGGGGDGGGCGDPADGTVPGSIPEAVLVSVPATIPKGNTAGKLAGGKGTLAVTMVMESAGMALWGCLSHLSGKDRSVVVLFQKRRYATSTKNKNYSFLALK